MMMPRPKTVLALLLAALSACVASAQSFTPTGPALGAGHTKWLGSAYSSPNQTLHFERYWNQVVAENASKWGSVEGVRDQMNWTALDATYNFAREHNLPFRFHVLFWGAQQPAWLRDLPAAEQLEEIDEWLAAIAARYPDLEMIEVVNEPLHDPPDRNYVGAFNSNANDPNCGNYFTALGGNGTTGWDWVLTAFRKARAAFPNARLMLNDYSITNDAAMTTRYVEIINLLKAENLIDVIGIQGHAFEHEWVSPAGLKANLDRLAATGLPIYVTEFDINGATDEAQLAEYQRTFPVFWEHPGVHGITFWGWRPGTWQATAYLVQSNGEERSAMVWLKEYLNLAPIVATQNFTVPEGSGAGTVVGTVEAHDWQHTGALTAWSITGGDTASQFAINPSTGELSIAAGAAPAAGTHTLQVSVADPYAESGTGTVRINVSNAAQKVTGGAYEFAADIVHANTNVYDQILITGANTTFRSDAGQIVRASYVDLSDDIVQIEYTGPGTVTVSLSGMTPPALPQHYNQDVTYVKGHATITVEGATELSNLTIFTVGTLTAGNTSLWKDDVTYDGVADIALVNISSPTNSFGGLRASNVSFWATSGNTGVNAPGVNFADNQPVNIHDISAQADATPVLLTGTIGTRTINGAAHANTILITGGDLDQANDRAILFGDAAAIYMGEGTTSHSVAQSAKTNQGTFTKNGAAFTPAIVP